MWSRWASFFYYYLFCRTVFSAGNATGKLFHFDTKTCDLLEEISLGEGQINVLKYSPKVWQYQLWSFKFGDKVQIFWEGHKFWDLLETFILAMFVISQKLYLAHVIKQPNLWIPNPQYLQLNFCFDFFNDSENIFWGFFEI